MRAWYDLKSKVEQVFFTTSQSEYWIDRGVRIERFNTGRIVIKNALPPGDFMHDLTAEQYMFFSEFGWEQGVWKVNVDEFERKLSLAKDRIRRLSVSDPKKEMDKAVRSLNEIEAILEDRKYKLSESLRIR